MSEENEKMSSPEDEYRQWVDQHYQAAEVRTHELRSFLNALDENQLHALRYMLQECYNNQYQVPCHLGAVTTLLDLKFGVCLACGQKHDEALKNMLGPESNSVKVAKHSIDYAENMAKYNLEPDEGGTEHVMCKGCNMWHDSLEDRMLRPSGPEGCQGCVEKAKWG